MAKGKYDKAKWLEETKARENEIKEQIKELSENYKTDPDQIVELLEFSSRFYQYSVNNTMLIRMQNPYACYVQSYDAWRKEGYSVKSGEKGIKVWVPVKTTYLKIDENDYVQLSQATKEQVAAYKRMEIDSFQKLHFCIGNTFDITQTTFPKEKYPEYFSLGYPSELHEDVFKGLMDFSKESMGVNMELKDLKSVTLRGYYSPAEKYIAVNELFDSTMRLSVGSHEVAHALMEHNGLDNKSSARREWEADALSVMLQSSLGLEIPDARKRHMHESYIEMMSERDIDSVKMEEILSNVLGTFRRNKAQLDACIERYVPKERLMEIIQQNDKLPAREQMLQRASAKYQSFAQERER